MSAGELLAGLPLVDAHCHRLLAEPVDAAGFERCCTEADRLPPGMAWDSPAGLAIRRWCPPALDLPAFAGPEAYLERRAELGLEEVNARLLRAAGLSHLLVDTGLPGAPVGSLARAAGAPVSEVVRLERVAEELAAEGVTAERFAPAYADRLAEAARGAVATKSVLAYRHGLDVDPARPGPAEVREAWRRGAGGRIEDPVLLRFLLWAGVDAGLPVQIHTGLGDADLRLRRSDPSLLQPWLAAVEPAGVAVVLLHCYPYHRQAGWLAAVYPHVFLDVGLAVGQVGAQAEAVVAESLELAPAAKVLFSTDGYRLPELYLVGAAQFRAALGRLLDRRVGEGAMGADDAGRVARMIGAANARRVYALATS